MQVGLRLIYFVVVITPQVMSITGVKVVNYCSPLYFANAEIFRQRVIKKVQRLNLPVFASHSR